MQPANSNIKATTIHTKVAQEADTLIVRSIFNESLPNYLWTGTEYTFLMVPAKETTTGGKTFLAPIYYTDVNTPSLSTTVSSDLVLQEELVTSAWSESVSACEEIDTGCFVVRVSADVEDATPLERSDECDCIREIPVANEVSDTFVFSISQPVSGALSSLEYEYETTVLSNQDPFNIQLKGAEESMFSRVDRFDVRDYYGNGVVFSNPNSKTSNILNAIFEDEYTNDILEKLINFSGNTSDLDAADVQTLSDFSVMLGGDPITFMDNSPVGVEKLVKLASLEYNDIFGHLDTVSKYDSDNLGSLLTQADTIYAGEILLFQKTDEPDSVVESLVVGNLIEGLSALDETFLSGDTEYPLSSLNVENVDPNEYCFWRIKYDTDERFDNLAFEYSLSGIPTEDLWDSIIEKKIQWNLLNQI